MGLVGKPGSECTLGERSVGGDDELSCGREPGPLGDGTWGGAGLSFEPAGEMAGMEV